MPTIYTGCLTSARQLLIAFAVSLTMLAITAAWMFFDPVLSWLLKGYTTEIRPRVIALGAIGAIAVISSGFIFFRLIFGGRQDRSLRALFAAIALVALWSGVFAEHERISWHGVMWEARRLVPRLKVDAVYLRAEWPRQDGELPYLGRFKFEYTGRAKALWIESWEYMGYTSMSVGPEVFRRRDHWICFDVGGSCGEIVYQLPDNAAADSETSDSQSPWHDYHQIFELEPNWYLVWKRGIPAPPVSARTCRWDSDRALIVPMP